MFKSSLGFAFVLLCLVTACGSSQPASVAKESVATTSPRKQYLWYCSPYADPDFAVADIYRQNDQLYAEVYQESGDGDEGGEEIVPVTQSAEGEYIVFTQSGAPYLSTGDHGLGRTRNLLMKIRPTGQQNQRIHAEGFLTLDEGPTGAEAEEYNEVGCANYQYLDVYAFVDLDPLADKDVDMTDKDVAQIEVPFEGALPTVEWKSESQCDNVQIWNVQQSGAWVKINVEPEFSLDDGLNACRIRITQPTGQAATVRLYMNVGD